MINKEERYSAFGQAKVGAGRHARFVHIHDFVHVYGYHFLMLTSHPRSTTCPNLWGGKFAARRVRIFDMAYGKGHMLKRK